MKIELDRETMPDELYNQLLLNFVHTAVAEGVPVNKHSQFKNWTISCEVEATPH
mgnify:CR=1 FL=1|jgi:hypothetical protein